MPRYYFDLYQGAQRISEDASGYDCPSDEDARQFARMSNGLVALDPVLSSPCAEPSRCSLERGQAEHLHYVHISRSLLYSRFIGCLASFLRLRPHSNLRDPP